jgi:ubiquinone/menaquinone biosynthesis C-methylase UbiE
LVGQEARVRELYEARDAESASASGPEQWAARWSPRNPQAVYFRQLLETALITALNEARIDLTGSDVLDVGCGGGAHLRLFAELGAERHRLHGIDLVPERIERGRLLAPDIDLRVANATGLPFDAESFDLVCEFTALCNLTERRTLQQVAEEMQRVLRPGGALLVFEIARAPSGAPYSALNLDELEELFQLAPVFVRPLYHRWTEQLSRRAPALCGLLERLPLPKTNLLAIFR